MTTEKFFKEVHVHEVRIVLNRHSRHVRRYLEQPFLLHKLLESINPDRSRVLWRLMSGKVLIRSTSPLDWRGLDLRHADFEERTHATFEPRKYDGDVFAINLLAYARKRPVTGPWKPKLPAEYLEWFQKQGDRYGFEVLESTVIRQDPYRVETSSMPIKILPAELMASVRINQADNFRVAFEEGIGRMRAFGCGLLLVRPVAALSIQ